MQFVQYRTMLNSISPELAKAMTYDQVQDGEEIVDGTDDHVNFDAFFLRDLNSDGNAESIRGTSKRIGEEDTLYMEISVNTAGYVKDGKITVNGTNSYLQTALPKDDELKENYIGTVKTIEFNNLNNGTQKLLTGSIKDSIGNNINNYSKVNSVTFTGTYVNENNEEIAIEKTVEFNVDWYGETKAEIYSTSSTKTNLSDRINEEEGIISLDFTINTREANQELILKINHTEAEIPQLNGYDPINVTYTGNATFNYDAETRKVVLEREAVVSEDGTVTTSVARTNSYTIKVVYPLEAYESIGEDTVSIRIPVNTRYDGYNNPSEEFENPYISNTATATLAANYRNPTGTVARFDITVGKSISTPTFRYIVSKQKPLRIYNGLSDMETDDTYQVRWEAYTGTDGASNGLVMKETKNGETQKVDNFIKTDSSKASMEEVTTNVGIGFSGADNLLKEDGWIKVYDEETGDLLATFTKNDWNKYTSSNPYRYELPVKHIRVETSETKAETSFYVYNIKELDDEYITTNYTREEFDKLQYIESNLVGYLGGAYINTDVHQAHYEAPYSLAEISISNNTISTQATERNEKITIKANYNTSYNQVGWVNGSFVVKLPEQIIDAQINNIEISNGSVSITSYELIEQEDGKIIKINTQNNNETPQSFNITIDLDITPDPRIATTSKSIELYASNEEACDYYYNANDKYDVNDNLNTEEKVNHDTVSLSMISPNSLLTNQVASNYDDKGSQVVSPQIADVKPAYGVVDKKEATIGVQIRNNYASTISDMIIIGKIPFEGNTYVLSGGELGSTFTTQMKNTGITVPEELKQYVTVYYSENTNPDKDITKTENGWKTADQVKNWDNIKTYLIDLGDYVMPTGAEYTFEYIVKIPNGVEFNQASYSHHGIYFSLDTDQGKYQTQVEPNKLGLRIAEKYNLGLTKYQKGKDKLVPGATYSITDEETGEVKTAVTNAQGQLIIKGLYAEKAYLIKEIKTPDDYELNSDVIRFIGHVDKTNGNLSIEKTQGTTKEDITVVKEEGEDYKVTVKVEDEVKASLKLHKTEQGTNTPIQNVKYRITGYGLSENGRILTTNINGEVTLKGLSINQEYTLEETKAEGYYLASPIKFRIVNNGGSYSMEITEGTVSSQSTTEVDSIPTITLNLEDEKIPTYSLQLIKQEKTTEATVSEDELIAKAETALADTEVTYLANAKFKLYKNDEEIGVYITDETGKVTISNLYQYIEGKPEEATYTLKEVLSPEGYAKVKDITFKVENKDGTLSLLNMDGTEENYTVEGTTVKLTIEDSPSFKLIKKDKETQEPIANVKFAIYNVDNGVVPATNSKGEILGTKETINGKEYYTVTTDEQGILTADLTEGLYKAVEVDAPDKYDLEGREYYFGIGASREAPEGMVATWAESIGGSSWDCINSVAETSDGGYIAGGYFNSSSIQVGDEILTYNGSNDGFIIKYNSNREVEWAKSIGGSDTDQITSVAETSDGGYIAGGYFGSDEIQVGNETLTSNGYNDGLIIKYGSNGKVEWAKSFGDYSDERITSVAATRDGGVIAGGKFGSNEIQVGDEILTKNGSNDGFIIRYSSNGTVEWAKNIGGSGADYIESVAETSDGGYIAGGYFGSDEIQVGNETLISNGSSDGIIIKYDANGGVKWAKSFGGNSVDYVTSVAETSDGGVIVGGYFYSDEIQAGDETITNNGSDDGFIIKYSSNGMIEWAKSIGGSEQDFIYSVSATNDGGVVVGGEFWSSSIQVGNETLTNTSTGNTDSLIIKYDVEGETEWAKNIPGNKYSSEGINTIVATREGGIIVGGYFEETIQVGSETLTTNGDRDGMIIKFEMQELPNPVITNANYIEGSSNDYIQSVYATSDGGYIAGGYFESSTIEIEDITLNNKGLEGIKDGFVAKYDINNQVEWAKSYGGSGDDYISSIVETYDGGYIAIGYFESSTIEIENYNINGNGKRNSLIIKYDSQGEIEWIKLIEGDISLNSVKTSKDGIVIAGYFSGTIVVEKDTFVSKGGEDGLVIKYDTEGNLIWTKVLGGTSIDKIEDVEITSDGDIVLGGYFYSNTIQIEDIELTNTKNNYYDGLIVRYNQNGEVEWADNLKGNNSDYICSLIATEDGGIIAGGYYYGTIELNNGTLQNNSTYSTMSDGLIIKYTADGDIEFAKNVGGNNNDEIHVISRTNDGGYIVGGYFESKSIQVGNDILENNGNQEGLIIKYDKKDEAEWAKDIGGSKDDCITSMAEKNNGKIVAGGYFDSPTIEEDGHTLENQGGSDGMILEIENQVGVPEVQELAVENSRKEFKITTDVNEANGTRGGSISGEDESPYETVKYGDNSTKQIVMTPDENYEIIGITVNGEEWKFTANADGTYTMPQFTNMTEDKHVVVTYALKSNKITINKVDSADNSKKLEGAIFEITSEDGTAIRVTTNSQGQAITQLGYGNYTITEIQAPEGYELNSTPLEISFVENGTHEYTIENTEKARVIVHHYLKNEDGTYTEIKVAEDEIIEKTDKDEYTTSPKLDLEKYELEKDENGNYVIPDNATGTYETDKTIEVIYYYEEKEIPLTVHHYIEGTEEKVPLKDGSLAEDEEYSGKEGEEYTTTAIEESKLAEDYELVETPSNANGTYTAPEVEVTYYYKKVVREVIINKYDKDGTTPIEGVEFSIASKETPEEEIGRYTTDSKGQIKLTLEAGEYIATETKVQEGYVMPEDNTTEFVVTKQDDVVALSITNEKEKGTVITHYYVIKEDGTTTEEKVPSKNGGVVEDVVQTGNVGDIYATKESAEVAENYKFVKTEGETSGEYINGTIEVIYYYKIKDPIIDSSIEKTTETTVVSEIDQVVPYTINYEATITDYKGNATVTIIDYLPYEINEELSDIAGGTYNAGAKTITWTESIEDINTFDGNIKEINITKEIEVVYANVDTATATIENRVTGTIKLDTPEKEETVEDTKEIPTDFKVDVAVEKVWDDEKNNSHRPESITLVAKNSKTGEEIDSKVVTKDNAVAGNPNEWSVEFTELPKYDSNGDEIKYEIEERETNEGDLEYYNTSITELGEDVAEEKGVDKVIQVTNSYKNKTPVVEDKIEKTGTEEITSIDDEVSYEINYTASIDEYIGEAEVTIVDYLPYEIDETKSDIAGGVYNAEERTITWVENLGHINTDENQVKEVNITKNVTVVYKDIDTTEEKMTNTVEGIVHLLEGNITEKVEDTHDTNINVEGTVIAKYLEEGTEKELSGEVEQTGKVGTEYTTTQKEITGYNFVRVEGETTGKYIEGTIEVIYYYTLKDPIIDDEIEKTSSTLEITNKGQAIPYTIEYNATITDYRGNATVTIVDYLPYEIDEGLSNISGGIYNRIEKTITWTEEITDIDTYKNKSNNINITKEIELVYVNMDVTQATVENRATGTIRLDTPEKEETTEENEIIPINFKIEVPVEKVWNDNEDTKGRRPESVTIQLTADGSEELNGEKLESVVLNEENNWKYTFENLAKYTEYGREIVYSVVEKETNEGDLEYYKEAVIENIGATIRVTNSYNLMETDLTSSIEKTGTEKITSSKDKVSYSIKYNAEITDYIGEAVVTIVDYLPYHIDEETEGTDLDGGIYDEDANTITWTVNIDHINTTTDGAYKVDETRDIIVVFSDLDASQKVMVNRVKGTIDLYETEQTNEVEDTYETEIEIPGKVIVKYVDKETGEEIPFREQDINNPEAETPEGGEQDEETYGYTIKGVVGDEYTTKQKEIYGYTYVENSGNTEGTMTEKDIVVTYYYEKTKAGKVTAIYIDEETGEEITYIEENEETGEQEEKTYKEEIEGYIGDKYKTEQKEIPNYDFVRVEGEPEGELTEEEKTVVYIYRKIPAKVIVRYLEKDNTPEDDTDNKVLAEEEVINGHSGDEYKTERKEIEYYKKADPEPENAEGTMTREDIIVTYYYEKIPSGTVTAIYVDEATGKEITYIEENKETGKTEEKTYKETYKGYCGEEYKTEAKEIPYYEYIKEKAPTNAQGIYTKEDVTVTYYYRQLPFNMAVDKNLIKIELNGEEQKVKNGKINKVEIPVDRVGDSTLKLEYSIVVSNTGKVEGTTEVIESLPKYFKVTDGTSKEWKKQKDGTLKLATKEIKPGESKEYKVVLEWERGANNFGALVNTVELTNVENPANFKETTLENNKSKAELVLAVKSGEDRSMRWVGRTIGILLILAGMVVYVRRKI